MSIIEVANLHKRYGEKVAVQDVAFSVDEGEIFGVLGPNGAGKTTTVECVSGIRAADRGHLRVLGLDPVTDRTRLRRVLGIQLQEARLPDRIRVEEALRLYASFHENPADVGQLLSMLDITDRAGAQYRTLSGGQQQRLSIALALVGRPRVAVLDELTTGLDPRARRETWRLVERVRDSGVTVVLVTHFMDEAERLCDRVAVVDRARIAALDTPERLVARVSQERGGGRATLEDAFVALTGGGDLL